ncbi:MAG: hypothetical protein KGH54_01180 [Candidatus Micrarchaeota archaeon]|nr:hypothetical protein [Candidatus Micrarchaeota archaeon]
MTMEIGTKKRQQPTEIGAESRLYLYGAQSPLVLQERWKYLRVAFDTLPKDVFNEVASARGAGSILKEYAYSMIESHLNKYEFGKKDVQRMMREEDIRFTSRNSIKAEVYRMFERVAMEVAKKRELRSAEFWDEL